MNSKDLKRAIAAAVVAAVLGVGAKGFAQDDKAPKAGGVDAAAHAANPGESGALSDKEKAEGWQALFDGKSTEHFRSYKKPDVSKGWQVVDGTLVCKHGGDLITKEQYASFDLILDYKIGPAGNSGVMFLVTEEENTPWMTGPEVQIQDNVKGHDPQLAGWLYQLYQPPKDEKTGKPIDATRPAGEWNTLRVRIDGTHGQIWMNGTKYEDFELWSADWNERVAKSKFGKMPKFAKAHAGHINLQDHGDEVAFRNIRIKVLDAGGGKGGEKSEKKDEKGAQR